ncbi:hypothetical protein CALVIDRAFT_603431 [Calocera viscosa TUFC12733]|uniref:Ras-GAP domain-containing protein n=1 Tax=Calocera viscosa (strain TUFC12733) TaxID=1330018 RepID=A0A167FRJ4_CALVF|nr:hypothetical protein CALVIDRAFT_603431 [Calocera viscosa TUFC12733]
MDVETPNATPPGIRPSLDVSLVAFGIATVVVGSWLLFNRMGGYSMIAHLEHELRSCFTDVKIKLVNSHVDVLLEHVKRDPIPPPTTCLQIFDATRVSQSVIISISSGPTPTTLHTHVHMSYHDVLIVFAFIGAVLLVMGTIWTYYMVKSSPGSHVQVPNRQLLEGNDALNPLIMTLQAAPRGALARRSHSIRQDQQSELRVVNSFIDLQAHAPGWLQRRQWADLGRWIGVIVRWTVGLQGHIRGLPTPQQIRSKLAEFDSPEEGIIMFQTFFRMKEQRDRDRAYVSKIIKIQSLFRMKQQREHYRQLNMERDIIRNLMDSFLHLNVSGLKFDGDIEVEQLNKLVLEAILKNRQLQSEITELDGKIALDRQRLRSFKEPVETEPQDILEKTCGSFHAAAPTIHGDSLPDARPSDVAADGKRESSQERRDLQHLRDEYLAQLFFRMSKVELVETAKRTLDLDTLKSFGDDQQREQYLFLKVFHHVAYRVVRSAPSIAAALESHPTFLSVVLQYMRPTQVSWLRETLHAAVNAVIGQPAINVETDVVVMHHAAINPEEMPSGASSDVSHNDVANDTSRSIGTAPRSITGELLRAIKATFPNHEDHRYSQAVAVGELLFLWFIHPAICGPDTFNMVFNSQAEAPQAILAEIGRMLAERFGSTSEPQLFQLLAVLEDDLTRLSLPEEYCPQPQPVVLQMENPVGSLSTIDSLPPPPPWGLEPLITGSWADAVDQELPPLPSEPPSSALSADCNDESPYDTEGLPASGRMYADRHDTPEGQALNDPENWPAEARPPGPRRQQRRKNRGVPAERHPKKNEEPRGDAGYVAWLASEDPNKCQRELLNRCNNNRCKRTHPPNPLKETAGARTSMSEGSGGMKA